MVEGGVVARGGLAPGARGPWHVAEPAMTHGIPLREALAEHGIAIGEAEGAAVHVEVNASRTPVAAADIARLREIARTRPLVLIALQNDAFLADVPEAAWTVSACDATPLTRRVVARALAAGARDAAGHRA